MTLAFPAPTFGTRHAVGSGRAIAAPRSTTATLPENLELLPLPKAMALLSRQQWLTARPAQHWQYVARRLHQHRGNAALRARAAVVTDLFTGSGVGVLAALWTQEREQQRAQLRAQAATCWSQLRHAPDAATASSRLRTIRVIDAQLRGLDRFDEAVSAGDVLALSTGAGTWIGEVAERRVATDRVNPESRPLGFAWLPSRQAFVGWLADAQRLELFQLSAGEMADWVRSLRTADPQTLTWSRTTIAMAATDLAADERQLVREVGELRRFRLAAAHGADGHGPGWARRTSPVDEAPSTNLVLTTTESNDGLIPVDLGSGEVAAGRWRKARWRQVWIPESGRSIRTWTDAARASHRQTASHRTVVSVLATSTGRIASSGPARTVGTAPYPRRTRSAAGQFDRS